MEKSTLLKNKKAIIIAGIATLVIVIAIVSLTVLLPMNYYNKAIAASETENFEEAIIFFEKAGNYKDSKVLLERSNFERGKQLYNDKDLDGALEFFVKAGSTEGKDEWVEKTAIGFLDAKRYEDAVKAFELASALLDENNKLYAEAMLLLENKDYNTAITNFEKCIDTRDAAEQILNAHYLNGKALFEEGNHALAYDEFQKCVTYEDSTQLANDCIFKMGESSWSYGNYEEAKNYYLQLPNGYTYNDEAAIDRLNAIKIYDSVKNLEGYYSVTKGDYRVTQTHNSTGIYHYWYNTSIGNGDFDIDIEPNKDGSVTVSGRAEGTRYTSYSSISSGVHTGTYSANFRKELTSVGMPRGVLYSDDDTTLRYEGGTTFKLNYNEVDRSQDVYFRYTYTSDFTFTKN